MTYTGDPEMHVVYYKQPMTPSLRVIAISENSVGPTVKAVGWCKERCVEDRGGEEEIGQGHRGTQMEGKGSRKPGCRALKGNATRASMGGKEPTREKIRRFERYRAWGPKVGQGKRREGDASRTV